MEQAGHLGIFHGIKIHSREPHSSCVKAATGSGPMDFAVRYITLVGKQWREEKSHFVQDRVCAVYLPYGRPDRVHVPPTSSFEREGRAER